MSDRPAHDPNQAGGRRRALKLVLWAGGTALGSAVAAPTVVFVAAPLSEGPRGGVRWIRTLKVDALREGEPTKVILVADRVDAWTTAKNEPLGSAWLVRKGDRVTAFSSVCPHLGCSIAVGTGGAFRCPCHESSFTLEGDRVSGPSLRGLDPLRVRIEDGVVYIDFRTFRHGTSERIEVG